MVIMFYMEDIFLVDLVKDEIARRNLSIREFSRLVGVSHPTISSLLNGEVPTYDLCKKLAPILHVPLEQMLRAAGLLPPKPNGNQKLDEALHVLSMLPPDDLEELIQIARLKLERQAQHPPSRKPKPARTLLKET